MQQCPSAGPGRRRALHPLRSLPAAAHGSAPLELGEGFHHRPQRILHRIARLRGTPATHRHVSATVCNECGDSCDIRVVTPDLGDADDEPSLSVGESTQTASTAGRARRLRYPLPLGALRRAGLSLLCFRKRRRHATYPHHPGSDQATLWPGHGRPHPPRRGFPFV